MEKAANAYGPRNFKSLVVPLFCSVHPFKALSSESALPRSLCHHNRGTDKIPCSNQHLLKTNHEPNHSVEAANNEIKCSGKIITEELVNSINNKLRHEIHNKTKTLILILLFRLTRINGIVLATCSVRGLDCTSVAQNSHHGKS